MKINPVELAQSRLPHPWAPVNNIQDALALGRMLYKDVADTVQDELQREICKGHSLYGVECSPVAYDISTGKDFLFLTRKVGFPFALVHFTWTQEPNSTFPSVIEFRCFDDSIKNERNHHGG